MAAGPSADLRNLTSWSSNLVWLLEANFWPSAFRASLMFFLATPFSGQSLRTCSQLGEEVVSAMSCVTFETAE